MKSLQFIFFFLLIWSTAKSQAPAVQWQKSLGGSFMEESPDIQQTSDGGYIVAGASASVNGDVTGNHGNRDFWVVKQDPNGNIQWQKSYGGSGIDRANSVRQTSDGGYIIAGGTESNNGDVSGNHGGSDFWIIKTDANGNLQWQKTFGGSGYDIAQAVRQTTDGGYIVAGIASSNDGNISGYHGVRDYWVVKTDASGNLQWQKPLGGESTDEASSIEQTPDGGYIVVGTSSSMGGDITGNHGNGDFWVVKLNTQGNIQWQKSLGGSNTDKASAVQPTSDNGYIIAGSSISNNGNVSMNHGNFDYWIIKLNSTGNLLWEKSYGGSLYDYAFDIKNTSDGGSVVAGYSHSSDREGAVSFGANDYWIIKLDPSGYMDWQATFGGLTDDYGKSIQQTSDGGYVISGYSDAITGTPGNYNYWIIKLGGQLDVKETMNMNKISLYPNPTKDFIYIDNLPTESTVTITDMSGRTLFSRDYNEKKVSIGTSQLTNGVYIIQATNKKTLIFSNKLFIKK